MMPFIVKIFFYSFKFPEFLYILKLRLIMTLYLQRVRDVVAEMSDEGRVHPDCRNASNPYHECSEYCFEIIAEVKARNQQNEPGFFTCYNFFATSLNIMTFFYCS